MTDINYIGPKHFEPLIKSVSRQFFPENSDSRRESTRIIVGSIDEISFKEGDIIIKGNDELNNRIDELYGYFFDRVMYHPESFLLGKEKIPPKTRKNMNELNRLCKIANILKDEEILYDIILDAIIINPYLIHRYLSNKLAEDHTEIDSRPEYWSKIGEISAKEPIFYFSSFNDECISPMILGLNSEQEQEFLRPMYFGNHYVKAHTEWNLGDCHGYQNIRKLITELGFNYKYNRKNTPKKGYTRGYYSEIEHYKQELTNNLISDDKIEEFKNEQFRILRTGHFEMMEMLSNLYRYIACPRREFSFIQSQVSPEALYFFINELNTKEFNQVISDVKKKQNIAYKKYKHVFELFDYSSFIDIYL